MSTLPSYTKLRTRPDLAAANKGFLDALRATATHRAKQTIGTPGGSSTLMTWHAPALDIWVAPDVLDNRTWNALGQGDPFKQSKVAPVLEINFPLRTGSSTPAGLALVDERGVTAFAHTGRVGGGKRGIGMAAFKAYHPWTEHMLIDGQPRDLYLLGDLSEPERLAENVSDFVHTVAEFKSGIEPSLRCPPVGRDFRPEFEGITHYTLGSPERVASYTHGRVVNGLYRALGDVGVRAHRNRSVDLFAEPASDHVGVVFEVKTSTDTQSLYTCVGQLMLLVPDPRWHKIAVLPASVPRVTIQRLEQVGILVLEYKFLEGERDPVFAAIATIVRGLQEAQGKPYV